MGIRKAVSSVRDAVVLAWYRLAGPPRVLHHGKGLNARILRLFGARVGRNTYIMGPITIHNARGTNFTSLTVGDNCLINGNNFLDISGGLTLERGSSIGPGVTIMTHNGYNSNPFLCDRLPHTVGFKQVVVREGACIKANALVVMGVVVGREAVVAGGSVVNTDVPDRHLVSGVPAKVVTEIV